MKENLILLKKLLVILHSHRSHFLGSYMDAISKNQQFLKMITCLDVTAMKNRAKFSQHSRFLYHLIAETGASPRHGLSGLLHSPPSPGI